MVAHILRLRLDLLIGALRAPRPVLIRRIIGAVLVVAALVGVWVGADRLASAPADVAAAVTIVAGSALTIGYFVAALVVGVDDQLSPRRFAVFGLSPERTAAATFVASVLSAPVLALVAIAVAVEVLWTRQGAPTLLTVVAMVLAVVTGMLLSRIGLALATLLLRDRRSRELSGLFLTAVIVVAIPVAIFFGSLQWHDGVPSALRSVAEVLALTPFGAAWAVPPASVGEGSPVGAILVAVGTVVVLAGVWVWLVRVLLTTTERPSAGRERAGLGWFAVTPGTPAGGIAARSLLYWLRDPRYLVNLIVVPLVAGVIVVPLLVVGVPAQYVVLIPAPLMALFFGWLAHNDLAYDSTALWMHVASAVRGTADRFGRLVPVLLVGMPLLAVAIPLLVMLHGRWAVLPAMIGVCASLFLCGLGLSSLSSVIAPYPASRPGDSPFQQPQRTHGGLAQATVLLGALVLSAPVFWFAWRTLTEDVTLAWATMWIGIGVGAVVLVVGILAGGAVFQRRGGALMEFVEAT